MQPCPSLVLFCACVCLLILFRFDSAECCFRDLVARFGQVRFTLKKRSFTVTRSSESQSSHVISVFLNSEKCKRASPRCSTISYPTKWSRDIFLNYDWFAKGNATFLCAPDHLSYKTGGIIPLFSQSRFRKKFFRFSYWIRNCLVSRGSRFSFL